MKSSLDFTQPFARIKKKITLHLAHAHILKVKRVVNYYLNVIIIKPYRVDRTDRVNQISYIPKPRLQMGFISGLNHGHIIFTLW